MVGIVFDCLRLKINGGFWVFFAPVIAFCRFIELFGERFIRGLLFKIAHIRVAKGFKRVLLCRIDILAVTKLLQLFERWLGKLTHLDYVIKKLRANTERVLIQLGYASLRRGRKKPILRFKRLRHSGFCCWQRFDDGAVAILAFWFFLWIIIGACRLGIIGLIVSG